MNTLISSQTPMGDHLDTTQNSISCGNEPPMDNHLSWKATSLMSQWWLTIAVSTVGYMICRCLCCHRHGSYQASLMNIGMLIVLSIFPSPLPSPPPRVYPQLGSN